LAGRAGTGTPSSIPPTIRTSRHCALFDRNDAESLAFIDSLSEDDLDSDVFPGVALWQTMSHVVAHGIQHRSEVALLLTHLGHSPGGLDLALFVWERAARRQVG
jgi:uncharacterized damage-inducible protein DinB